jgi:hypothetical protein
MENDNSKPIIKNAVKLFLPAAIFLFLAIMWTDQSALFRYSAAAAGVVFAVQGIRKLIKDRKN